METRNSTRIRQTPRQFTQAGSERTQSKRITVSDASWQSQTLPAWVNRVKIKNAGSQEIRIRFNAGVSDYFSMASGVINDFELSGSVVMFTRAAPGGSTLECVFS